MKHSLRLAVTFCCAFVAACSKPLLVVDAKKPTADVEFINTSKGHLQQFFFDDPVTCEGTKLIDYSVDPLQSTNHKIPAERVITIWTSAFGLPAALGQVAWCRPHAFSARLEEGKSYKVKFVADPSQKKCGTLLTSSTGGAVHTVQRKVSGPEVGGGGPLAGPMSCSATDDLSSLR